MIERMIRPGMLLAAGMALWAGPAQAALIGGYTGTFALSPTATAPSEADSGTNNPSYTYQNVRTYGTLSISYGPYFNGQTYAFDPSTQPIPAETSDTAAPPLSLATSDPNLSAIIEDDADSATNPVIGGTVYGAYSFIGPIAILFSMPVAAFELTVGDLQDANQIILEAFAANGSSLGSVQNGIAGYQQFDLSSDLGPIAGISIRSVSAEGPTNVGISGLGVYTQADVPPTTVPGPGPSALLVALGAMGLLRRRR